MPAQIGCPCGAHVTDPDGLVTYVTDELIDLVFTGVLSKLKYLGVLAPYIGNVLDVATICASPKPPQPEWELADFVTPQAALLKASQLLRSKVYELNCTCDDCPPITGCGMGTNVLTVIHTDGYDPTGDNEEWRYHIPTGADLWIEGPGGGCFGLHNGVWIIWTMDGPNPSGLPANRTVGHIHIGDGNDVGPGTNWWAPDYGESVTIYFSGPQEPVIEPIPEAPDGVADWYGPPACTNSDICASLAVTEERIRRIEFLATVIAGPLYGVTATYSGTFPGMASPITGTLSEYLPRALAALAPITAAQLANPVVDTIDTSSLVDVEGAAYVRIALVTVPPYIGSRGTGASEIYYSRSGSPGPGWLLVMGADGVLSEHRIAYPLGMEIALPATATDLAIHLEPGVEITVTTYTRQVSA